MLEELINIPDISLQKVRTAGLRVPLAILLHSNSGMLALRYKSASVGAVVPRCRHMPLLTTPKQHTECPPSFPPARLGGGARFDHTSSVSRFAHILLSVLLSASENQNARTLDVYSGAYIWAVASFGRG